MLLALHRSRRIGGLAVVLVLFTFMEARAETILADFNGTGFNSVWGGFNQIIGPSSVRVYDPADGWGGATINAPGVWDFSALANERLTLDYTANAGNGIDRFEIEMFDRGADGIAGNSDDRSGKWGFSVINAPGVATHLVAASDMANPAHGVGDWQNLDLTAIDRWGVIGQWQSTEPFDLSFDRVAIADEIPPPYDGWEPDAPWRADAAARIDAHRKADMQVRVTDATGRALPGAQVDVTMQKHAFGFGSAVEAFRLRDANPAHDAYKQKVAELFNEATLENNLKWPAWEGEWGSNFTREGAVSAVAWLRDQGIQVRGHALVWPGSNHLPQPIRTLLAGAPLDASEQQTLRDAIAAHIAEEAGYAGLQGELVDWDVINEPRVNHDIMDALAEGDLAMVDWFQAAATADPNAKLFLNEYNIIASGGGTDTSSQQTFYDTLEFLVNNGAPIDGVGIQGHFSESSLTGPEQLWTIFDRFSALGLDLKVTEFTFGTDDEELQAAYTRDFLTAVFAHEDLDALVQWGFWDGENGTGDSAMFREDWSIKPNGQAYLDLVFDQWWTDEQLLADLAGEAALRAFKGEYEIEVTFGGATHVFTVTLTDGGLVLNLALDDVFAADFDHDGDVDGDDFLAWQSGFGVSANGDADFDGDTDGDDFLIWQSQLGLSAGSGSGAVPEPGAIWLAPFIVGGLLLARGSKRA